MLCESRRVRCRRNFVGIAVCLFVVLATIAAWQGRSLRDRLETFAYHAFAYSHVRLVDRLPNGSFLFRTGLPLTDPWFSSLTFDEKRIREVLRDAVEDYSKHMGLAKESAKNASWTELMDHWPLVDVTLLTHETDALDVERAFFKQAAAGNDLVQYPTNGIRPEDFERVCAGEECVTMQPRDLDSEKRVELAKSFVQWDPDHSVARVKTFIEMVSTGKPRLYFFHCVCGCDRTGQFFVEYTLTKDPTLSFQQLLLETIAVMDRTMFYHFQVAAQWYCEYLKAIGIYQGHDCGQCDEKLRIRCKDTGNPWDKTGIRFYVRTILILACAVVFLCCLFSYLRRRKIQEFDAREPLIPHANCVDTQERLNF